MDAFYSRSETLSTTIYIMEENAADRKNKDFGAWLRREMQRRGMNQAEFAKRAGVGTGTVSRWVNGRRPEADYVDKIADALVLDYDVVATRAGHRPPDIEIDPESATARLMPLIEQIDWESRPGRIEEMEAELRFMIEVDRLKAQNQK